MFQSIKQEYINNTTKYLEEQEQDYNSKINSIKKCFDDCLKSRTTERLLLYFRRSIEMVLRLDYIPYLNSKGKIAFLSITDYYMTYVNNNSILNKNPYPPHIKEFLSVIRTSLNKGHLFNDIRNICEAINGIKNDITNIIDTLNDYHYVAKGIIDVPIVEYKVIREKIKKIYSLLNNQLTVNIIPQNIITLEVAS